MHRLSKITIVAALFALSGCGVELGFPDGAVSSPQKKDSSKFKKIFVTESVFNGKLGSGGIAEADALCMADENKPSSGSYRAFLVDGVDRVAMPVVDRIDWVLKASTEYVREDGTVIGTTTSSAVFPQLSSAISPTTALSWTGLSANYLTNANHCNKWASDSASASGSAGQAKSVDSHLALDSVSTCEAKLHLICVQQ